MSSCGYQHYRGTLTTKQQQVYDYIYRAWTTYKTEVCFSTELLEINDLSIIVEAIIKDHPELFWVDYYEYSITYNLLFTKLVFKNFFEESEIVKFIGEASAWQRRIAAQIPGHFSRQDKIWLLFDYLARQVTYGKQSNAYSQTIIGPLSKHNHVSVCEGIAKSFKFMCDKVGIPCLVVFGTADFGPGNSGPHAWNMVDPGTGYKHIDVTAELHFAHLMGKATKKNFLHSDGEMKQYQWDRRYTPMCG